MTSTIRIWVYDGILASGVAGPIDVFHAANRIIAREKPRGRNGMISQLTWTVESLDGQPVKAAAGQSIAVDGKIDPTSHAEAILICAPYFADMDEFMARRAEIDAISSALRSQHKAGRLLAAYCTGNYLLAEAGLLEKRAATVHWEQAAEFARRYPTVELRAQEVVISQDGIISSGAVTSYLNLAVRLVEALVGEKVASATAKSMLIDMNRISQASYATLLGEHGHADPLVARAQKRMEAKLQEGFQLSALAASLAVSERTLNRRFKRALGQAPIEYLQNLRVEIAKQTLESRPIALGELSQRVGYGDVGTFRELFRRKTGLSPREYRLRFARAHSSKEPETDHC